MTRAAVAVVATFYRPVLGGAEVAAERLAAYLVRRGHAVTVLTKRTSSSHAISERIDGVAVERLPPIGERTGRGKWTFLPALLAALLRRRGSFDVICCVDYRATGLAALAAGRLAGVPVVFQAQTEGVMSADRVRGWLARLGVPREGAAAHAMTWPIRALYRQADALACISRAIEREALAMGMAPNRVHYLPNPVDIDRFRPATPAERGSIRAELGVPADAVLAVFVGRLSREKGAMELLRAWAAARPVGRLAIVGPSMPGHSWDVSDEARQFVTAQQLGDVIQFTGGQPADVVAQWLRAADFAVQPSHFEAMGLAAAEEMAAGLPVVASDTGGFRDFISDGKTGLLVPVGDVEALAAAISRLAGDAPLRAALGRHARQQAEQFDEQIVLERFGALLDSVAGHG